jgi:hypothetical protein
MHGENPKLNERECVIIFAIRILNIHAALRKYADDLTGNTACVKHP